MSWSPQREECAEQCPSCPFRKDNDEEWRTVASRLAAKHGLLPLSKFEAFVARTKVWDDVKERGDFICHCSAYDKDMNMTPAAKHRQCKGATEFHLKHRHPKTND